MIAFIVAIAAAALAFWLIREVRFMTRMPGRSYRGQLPALTADETLLARQLESHVRMLSETIGDRHWQKPGSLERSIEYIDGQLGTIGYAVRRHVYRIGDLPFVNLEVEIPGSAKPDEIIVIGAHYDTYLGSPGADDNATGIAAVLELAGRFRDRQPARTLRFVAFAQEERPNGEHGTMGSQIYARNCRAAGEKIVVALALESMGYYSDRAFSQWYPPPFCFIYPHRGNFIGFIGDTSSRDIVARCLESFRRHTRFPSEGVASWRWIPGVGSSDHESFWREGYPGVMVTTTAPFRNPHYHKPTDTPENVDFRRLAIVVAGLEKVIEDLAAGTSEPDR